MENALFRLDDIAFVALELDRRDRITGNLHFGEPGGERFFVRGFHHAEDFAFGEVAEAAIGFDHRIVLGGFGELIDLFAFHRSRGQRVRAHEFGHDEVPMKKRADRNDLNIEHSGKKTKPEDTHRAAHDHARRWKLLACHPRWLSSCTVDLAGGGGDALGGGGDFIEAAGDDHQSLGVADGER